MSFDAVNTRRVEVVVTDFTAAREVVSTSFDHGAPVTLEVALESIVHVARNLLLKSGHDIRIEVKMRRVV